MAPGRPRPRRRHRHRCLSRHARMHHYFLSSLYSCWLQPGRSRVVSFLLFWFYFFNFSLGYFLFCCCCCCFLWLWFSRGNYKRTQRESYKHRQTTVMRVRCLANTYDKDESSLYAIFYLCLGICRKLFSELPRRRRRRRRRPRPSPRPMFMFTSTGGHRK